MNLDSFRRLALSFPDTTESAHMNHADFRFSGKVFATLGLSRQALAMVRLTPEEQDNVSAGTSRCIERMQRRLG